MRDHASKETKSRNAQIVLGPQASAWWAVKLDGGRVNDIIFSWLQVPNTGPVVSIDYSENSLDGRSGAWSKLTSFAGATGLRRSGALITPSLAGGRSVWVRVTTGINQSKEAVTYQVQANEKNGDQPFDSIHLIGASREAGQRSDEIERAVMAAYPGRDPLVFVSAIPAASIETIISRWKESGARTRGLAYYAVTGSVIGNNITKDRPYSSIQKEALNRNLEKLLTIVADNDQKLIIGNISFRAYRKEPFVTIEDQELGSKPYNDQIVHSIASRFSPESFDEKYKRPFLDEYIYTLRNRHQLSDGVHAVMPRGDGYSGVINFKVRTLYHWIYNGHWPKAYVEELVDLAEQQGGRNIIEAKYAVDALADSAGKESLRMRLEVLK